MSHITSFTVINSSYVTCDVTYVICERIKQILECCIVDAL